MQAVIDGTVVDSAQLVGGAATLEVGPFDNKGAVEVEIRYLGDTVTDGDTTSVSISVVGSTKAPGSRRSPNARVLNGVDATGVASTPFCMWSQWQPSHVPIASGPGAARGPRRMDRYPPPM